jgi:hypothetical protein
MGSFGKWEPFRPQVSAFRLLCQDASPSPFLPRRSLFLHSFAEPVPPGLHDETADAALRSGPTAERGANPAEPATLAVERSAPTVARKSVLP